MRKTLILALATTSFMMVACNTIAGAGRDVQAAGRVVTGAATDAKK